MLNQKDEDKQIKNPDIDGMSKLTAQALAVSSLLTVAHESEQVSKVSRVTIADAVSVVSDMLLGIQEKLRGKFGEPDEPESV